MLRFISVYGARFADALFWNLLLDSLFYITSMKVGIIQYDKLKVKFSFMAS